MMGLVPSQERFAASFCAPHTVRTQQDDGQPQTSEADHARTLISDFPGSRTVRNKFVVNTCSMVSCYSSPNRQGQPETSH